MAETTKPPTAPRTAAGTMIDMVSVLPAVPAMVANGIATFNGVVQMLRALGLSDDEILLHIAQSETKLDPLVARLPAFKIDRHPGDTEP